MMFLKNILFVSIVCLGVIAAATPIAADEASISFDDSRWNVMAQEYRIEEHEGRKALFLRNGVAILGGEIFKNGIVEFDILTDLSRGFSGLNWHVQRDLLNSEEFYIRHHQGGNPDANQYSPVFNGVPAWQLYYGPWYSVPVSYDANVWIHIKIVVSGDQAEVYIDSEEPVLFIGDLLGDFENGSLVLRSSLAPVHFSNFRVEHHEAPQLRGKPLDPPAQPDNLTERFEVSMAFDSAEVDSIALSDALLQTDWVPVTVDALGFANLSRVAVLGEGSDTVLARVQVQSDVAQTRRLIFGFSDRIRIFYEGEAIYAGEHVFESKDYRYLGTTGFFDSVFLKLKPGLNTIYMAVSESFGGWGVGARFDSMDGLTFAPLQ